MEEELPALFLLPRNPPFDYIRQQECYGLIETFYGDQRAKRSKVPYMNHINEGLVILDRRMNNTERRRSAEEFFEAAAIFCMHPIVQDDKDVTDGIKMLSAEMYSRACRGFLEIPSNLMLVMEYRNVANRGLHCRQVANVEEIYLSPIQTVNEALIADKCQNYKDFARYHADTHPKAAELSVYFRNWLKALGVSEEEYLSLVEGL